MNESIIKLNNDIEKHFPHIFKVDKDYERTFEGISRMVMLDRYSQKDINHITLGVGDLVITVVKDDPTFPVRGIGIVRKLTKTHATILLEEEYRGTLEGKEVETGEITRHLSVVDKPLELYFEQIAKRVGYALADKEEFKDKFFKELKELNLVPAGRVLHGAGSNSDVTWFNCYVQPMIQDSRGGISDHRKEVMEIMSRGGGVGTNGSTLRPRGTIAKSVGGKSSGSVSWLNDLANLTHLVEQGGSRRGAQMIMMADWHPDIIEFIVSKMQNPKILKWLTENSKDSKIKEESNAKLKFNPLSQEEITMYEAIIESNTSEDIKASAKKILATGGKYEVVDPEFLTGANISVAITKEFMDAVEKGTTYDLRYPDLVNLTKEQKEFYDNKWHEIGDVREWEKLGYPVKTYYTIDAKEMWNLISFAATYSAEPGIFFIDNANMDTNATAYDQKVVATNPCGEQPLAPYSVCNLAAVNLANFVNKETGEILYDKLKYSVATLVRMQDNVIDKTPYFLEANTIQALGERRVGLGVMGLHDLLIFNKQVYGSKESLEVIDKVFKTITTTAYRTSIELAKEKGSFPFLENNHEKLISTGFIKKLPEDIRQDILKYGIRNSHLITVAPTGSTGTMVGVSTGLEPYFSFSYFRSGRLGKFIEVNADIVNDFTSIHTEYTKDNLPEYFVSAMDLSPEAHADVQTTIQYWVDSSISKTVNAPKGYTVEQVQSIYERLYHNGAKGGTVYVDGSRDSQVLSLTNDEDNFDGDKEIVEPLVEVEVKKIKPKEKSGTKADRQDREIGVDIGNICPICLEGVVENIGGCHTCTNCSVQLTCGL